MEWVHHEAAGIKLEYYNAYYSDMEFMAVRNEDNNVWAAFCGREGMIYDCINGAIKIVGEWKYEFKSADEAKEVCERFANLMVLL